MNSVYRAARFCRLCNNTKLSKVLDLGVQYVTSFPKPEEIDKVVKAPLVVLFCPRCGLPQLQHTVHRDLMYRNYSYRSGTSATMRAALADVVRAATKIAAVKAGDLVIDIGSNDNTLLNNYPPGVICIGFEPAQNIGPHPVHITIKDFFSLDALLRQFPLSRPHDAKVITSVACFYDVEYPLPFMRDVADLLAPDGIWINQMNYISAVIQNNALDFFSHEHLTHWWTRPLEFGLGLVGLQLFRVDTFPLNGGTARFYICPEGSRTVEDSVEALRGREKRLMGAIINPGAWSGLQRRAEQVKTSLNQLLTQLTAQGKRVFVYGACYDTETRAITPEGFKTGTELKPGDQIFTLNPDTREIEVQAVEEVLVYPYQGSMVHFQGKRVDLLVSPNHSMLLERHSPQRTLAFELATDTLKRCFFTLPRGHWNGRQSGSLEITAFFDQGELSGKARQIPDSLALGPFLYLLGLFIGDGYLDTHSQGYGVRFCVPEGDKARNRLEATLQVLELSYTHSPTEVGTSSKALCSIFVQCGTGAKSKRIPPWALEYDQENLRWLFEGLIDSDGWWQGERGKYVTTSEGLVKDLVELGIKLGLSPTFSQRSTEGYIGERRVVSERVYTIRFGLSRVSCYPTLRDGRSQAHYEDYQGDIWCVSVKNRNFLVERRGKVAFCGNSTRGNTLLQYCGLDSTLLPYALDRDPAKWGRVMVGSNITIVSEEEGRRERPDYLLVLPYSYLKEFQLREKEFLDRGGKFIVPLPEPRIVGAES